MKNKSLFITLALGLGLTVALMWLLSPSGSGLPAVRAASYTVCPAGPPTCGYSVIQDAVDAAGDGDVIKVAAGTYNDVNNYYGLAQVIYIGKSVTIRGGYTTAFTEPPDPEANPTTLDAGGQGRVLFVTGNSNPTIEGLRITGGDATVLGIDQPGGGVQISYAEGTIRNNYVFSNTAGWDGGGGLYLDHSAATLTNNVIISNTSSGCGGGLEMPFSPATLTGNTISSNTANACGGGVYVNNSAATLTGNTISDNTARWGGGLDLWQSPATLTGNTISDNSAYGGGGGGLSLNNSDATLTNNVIADNQAGTAGSGLRIIDSLPSLLHTTIARNTGGGGRGVSVLSTSTVAMTNTIIVSHTVGIRVDPGGTAILESTLWGNGLDWEVGGTFHHSNDHWGNPDFVDPDNGDYHIGGNSAAIDAGVDAGVTNDFDSHPRPYLIPDIGADEYWPPGALKYLYLPIVLR